MKIINKLIVVLFIMTGLTTGYTQNDFVFKIIDEKTSVPLNGAKVVIKNMVNGRINTFDFCCSKNGYINIKLEDNFDFSEVQIQVSAEKYLNEFGVFEEDIRPYDTLIFKMQTMVVGDGPLYFLFDLNSDSLMPNNIELLDYLIHTLKENPTIKLKMQFCCDESEINRELLLGNRSKKVTDYIYAGGIKSRQLKTENVYDANPCITDAFLADKYKLQEGEKLNKEFIQSIADEKLQWELRKYNSRIDFKVEIIE